jgi:uncharacterized membrane protein YfcA
MQRSPQGSKSRCTDEPALIAAVVSILLLATFIRSAFGFGEALVAVPLLALVMPVETAVPLAMLVSITVAAVVVLQDWRRIHLGSAWRLVASTLVGIPLGLFLLTSMPEALLKGILGLVIIAFAAFSLLSRNPAILKDDRHAWLYGFAGGILGGAYGMNGPPLVVYGALRRWSPQHFRATLQGYFLPASIAAMFGYWLAGLWTPQVTQHYLVSLPAVVLAIFAGRAANNRMDGPRFMRLIHTGLLIIGVTLLLQAAG